MPSDFGDIPPQNSRSTRHAPRPCGGRMRGDARIAPRGAFSGNISTNFASLGVFSAFGSTPEASPGAFSTVGNTPDAFPMHFRALGVFPRLVPARFAFREHFRAWGGIAANGNRACGHFESLNERMPVVVLAAKLPVACRKLGSDGEARKRGSVFSDSPASEVGVAPFQALPPYSINPAFSLYCAHGYTQNR